MADQRSAADKFLWDRVGPPLYYCADCLRAVKVAATPGAEPVIERPCGPDCAQQVIAPRRAVCVGQGGANMGTRVKVAAMQAAATLTGRCV